MEQERLVQRQVYAPSSMSRLDPGTATSLQRLVRQQNGESVIAALPAFVGSREQPRSTMRQRMATWLESTEGQAWQRQRQELLLVGLWKCGSETTLFNYRAKGEQISLGRPCFIVINGISPLAAPKRSSGNSDRVCLAP